MEEEQPPILTAVSSSARQLFLLLRCVAFANKAHVNIGEQGVRFSVDEASAMEASAFLDKSLFTTYQYHAPTPQRNPVISDSEDDEDDEPPPPSAPHFFISLPALLETLQIFGLTDPNTSKPPWARDNPYPTSTAFSNNVLGMNNLCRLSYDSHGAPLSVILTEASIRTTCDLTTYEPNFTDEIPFDRQNMTLKIVMRGSWLFDAIAELSSTTPEKLSIYAKLVNGKPFFALSSSGTLGSARVEFNNEPKPSIFRMPVPITQNATENGNGTDQNLLETFQLRDPHAVLKATYKYSLIQKAARAMSVANKVSVRVDEQGVLSMQFMVEMEGGGGPVANAGAGTGNGAPGAGSGKLGFVDFRFVPLVEGEDDEEVDGADETLMQNGHGGGSRSEEGSEDGSDMS